MLPEHFLLHNYVCIGFLMSHQHFYAEIFSSIVCLVLQIGICEGPCTMPVCNFLIQGVCRVANWDVQRSMHCVRLKFSRPGCVFMPVVHALCTSEIFSSRYVSCPGMCRVTNWDMQRSMHKGP